MTNQEPQFHPCEKYQHGKRKVKNKDKQASQWKKNKKRYLHTNQLQD